MKTIKNSLGWPCEIKESLYDELKKDYATGTKVVEMKLYNRWQVFDLEKNFGIDKTVTDGNALIKEFLQKWAPSIHRNYERFNTPFEFHDNVGTQYMAHGQLEIYLGKMHPLMILFREQSLSHKQRFDILVEAVKAHNEMKVTHNAYEVFS